MTTIALARRGRKPLASPVLRDLRHPGAHAAREATTWLWELEGARKSPRTVSEYGRIIDGLIGRWPDKTIGEFTTDDLTDYIFSQSEGSRSVVKSACNRWFVWARKHGRIDSNPVELVPDIAPKEQTLVPIFTDTQVAALSGLPDIDGVLCRLLFSTGIRMAEARGLQVKHVNFDDRHIEIHKGKGRKDRLVPLPPTLAGKLDHLFTTDGMGRDEYLWYSRPGGHWRDHSQPVASTTFYRWWSRCLEDAGVPYLKPHTTRHTFATRAVRSGMSIDKVRRILGHKNIATTVQMYVHMSVEDMHDDLAMLETF